MGWERIIGVHDSSFLTVNTLREEGKEDDVKEIDSYDIPNTRLYESFKHRDKVPKVKLPSAKNEEIYQASIFSPPYVSTEGERKIFLLATVTARNIAKSIDYKASLAAVDLESVEILHVTDVSDWKQSKLHVHFMKKEADRTPMNKLDGYGDINILGDLRFRIILLTLDQHVVTHDMKLTESGFQFQTDEQIAKSFWWAQWDPVHEHLALAHDKVLKSSQWEEESQPGQLTFRPFLSILQFHEKFPRETVLNIPLSNEDAGENSLYEMIEDSQILKKKGQFKLMAHMSGAVYLFQLSENKNVIYHVKLLHHNMEISVKIKDFSKSLENDLKLGICLHSNAQYMIVIGWPYFVHLLDVGVTHEPSHHLSFDLSSLLSEDCLTKNLYSCFSPSTLVFEDGHVEKLTMESSKLLRLISPKNHPLKSNNDSFQLKVSLLHFFIIHNGDMNAAKRIVYEEGRDSGNLMLKKIYQEFLLAAAYWQTKKQILSAMEGFLGLLPYTFQDKQPQKCQEYAFCSFHLKRNSSGVSRMLLSPRQRVFPHNVTDIWTSLWENCRRDVKRFSNVAIADKLLLALQCYKPEALSRASTPMSPSSPMVCSSAGDIAGLFSRRTTDLQLPFIEHESCTANKQEYIFSIALRELSMYLLKQRKESPLHSHTVAGKYICSLVDTGRLLCHIACLTADVQPTKNRDKGFPLVEMMSWESKLKLYILLEHYYLALSTLACPLPQGFSSFFAYLAYNVLPFSSFVWHVKSGVFDLQIDLVKTILAGIPEDKEANVKKKLQLISLLPKSRASRVLNNWTNPVSIMLRAKQHSSDLLSGTISQNRKPLSQSLHKLQLNRKKQEPENSSDAKSSFQSPLDTFFDLLAAKASTSDIDLGLLTEATLLSMQKI